MKTTDETERKKLSLGGGRNRLSLGKSVETTRVQQSFPHGRSKVVQVERRRKRSPGSQAPSREAGTREGTGRTLTPEERAARERALQGAMQHDVPRESLTEATEMLAETPVESAQPVVEEVDRRQAEQEEARQIAQAEEQRQAEEARRLAEEQAARNEQAQRLRESQKKTTATVRPAVTPEDTETPARTPGGRRREAARKTPAPSGRRGEPRRRHSGKMTINQALDDGAGERARSLASVRRARERERRRLRADTPEAPKRSREVIVPDAITVQELANRMAEKAADVVMKLMTLGVMATINQTIDADTAELVTTEFGHRVRRVSESDVETGLGAEAEDETAQQPRAPVVTVMGHVDHGKTSLLDAMRKTSVAAGEAGGITQHIGAYQVQLEGGEKITFLDTPGHEAFTEMRARGANVTDIVVLVVAVDDGVVAQTEEAIRHARAAKTPIIVAVNKMDLPDADPERVRNQLLNHDIVVEELGGDVMLVPVSAMTGQGLDRLQEAILLQAELLELKANPDRPAAGAVIESKMERGRGSVATILVQHGTLRVGNIFVAGAEWGRVRALIDDRGRRIKECGPSFPVEVLGLNGSPLAGDKFDVVENESRAREIVDYRQRQIRSKRAAAGARGTVEQMLTAIAAGQAEELPLVIKTDVHGSLEAIRGSLENISNEAVAVRVLHGAVGGINESDVTLAAASGAMVIGFNVRPNPQARELARRDDVEIRLYSIIYNVIDDVRSALTGLLAPDLKEEFLGYAEIREVFNISKVGKVAGCMVTEGMVRRGAKVRLLRDNVVIHEGALKTLRRFKEEVREVREGYECGAAFENYHDIQVGDLIESFEVRQVERTLESVERSQVATQA